MLKILQCDNMDKNNHHQNQQFLPNIRDEKITARCYSSETWSDSEPKEIIKDPNEEHINFVGKLPDIIQKPKTTCNSTCIETPPLELSEIDLLSESSTDVHEANGAYKTGEIRKDCITTLKEEKVHGVISNNHSSDSTSEDRRDDISEKQHQNSEDKTQRKVRRAISETRSPSEHVRMTKQLLEANRRSVLNDTVHYEDEEFHLNVIQSNLSKIDEDVVSASHKRNKKTALKRCNTAEFYDFSDKPKEVDKGTYSDDENEQNYFLEETKPANRRRRFKRTVSLGFSKFRQKKSHQKFQNEYSPHEVSATGHETSRRKGTECDDEPVKTAMEGSNVGDLLCGERKRPLVRTMSEPIPYGSDEDENLDELYLPRRMAICPDLPVPAMKQLKTYLILTRLRQYCFV